MRPEKLYLVDIVEAADAIERFLTDIDRDKFDEDDLRQSAGSRETDAHWRGSRQGACRVPGQPPRCRMADIVGFRNIGVHEYFAVNGSIRLGRCHPGCAQAAHSG